MYSKAIQEDSLFAAAYAKRAGAYDGIYWQKFEGWDGIDRKALEDLERGLQINPALPELKYLKAKILYNIDRKYDSALIILDELKKEALIWQMRISSVLQ